MISDNRSVFPVGEGEGSARVCVYVCVCFHEILLHFALNQVA